METKKSIYDELCSVLTDFEEMDGTVTEEDLYNMLCKIQNNWEVITETKTK